MIHRSLLPILEETLHRQPAVVLLGPRQVGKTTLAHEVGTKTPSFYLDLESPEDLQKLSDPLLYLKHHQDYLIILDEIQRVPDLFPILRGLIDERRRRGIRAKHFLLLGSASLDLIKHSSESLAGRVSQLELHPFTALEVAKSSHNIPFLWTRGGFPESYLGKTDLESYQWRQDFLKTYREREIPLLGFRFPAETLRRFWTMLAHSQGSIFNASQLAASLGISSQTVARYLDLLVDLFLMRRLAPYHSNVKKRLVRSPKIYIRDTGLLHALLGIRDYESLQGHPILGASFESFVIENCLNCAPPSTHAYFYRTSTGDEIDLLLEFPNGTLWAIEIKRSLSPKLEKGFFSAKKDLHPTKSFIIYGGNDRYFLQEDVEVLSLVDFLTDLSSFS